MSELSRAAQHNYDNLDCDNMCNPGSDPTQPPRLVRSLSDHHWYCGKLHMKKKQLTEFKVGRCLDWHFFLWRKNRETDNIRCITIRNGRIEANWGDVLPKPRRCSGKTLKGLRCKRRKVIGRYYECDAHRGSRFLEVDWTN
jgi:hypothetical protein